MILFYLWAFACGVCVNFALVVDPSFAGGAVVLAFGALREIAEATR